MFAIVLGMAGFILLSIFDDCVERIPFGKVLTYPGVGILLWGSIWLLYALGTATDVENWWTRRLPEFGAEISREDALWFAYISTSTIGLGDFFLQPEVIFASDTLKYSATFMIGFVFLSTFFGKIAESLAWMLPRRESSFQARLKATRPLACWKMGLLPWERDTPSSSTAEKEGDDTQEDDAALLERIKVLENFAPEPRIADMDSEETDDRSSDRNAKAEVGTTELLEREKAILEKLLNRVQTRMDDQNREGEKARPLGTLFEEDSAEPMVIFEEESEEALNV